MGSKGIERREASAHAGALFDGDRDLLDDFEAEALEGGDVHGRVGEQADALDAQVGQDLAAEADGAENAAGARLRAFAGAQLLMQDEAAGLLRSSARRRAAAAPLGIEWRRLGVWSIAKPREVLWR